MSDRHEPGSSRLLTASLVVLLVAGATWLVLRANHVVRLEGDAAATRIANVLDLHVHEIEPDSALFSQRFFFFRGEPLFMRFRISTEALTDFVDRRGLEAGDPPDRLLNCPDWWLAPSEASSFSSRQNLNLWRRDSDDMCFAMSDRM